MNASRSLDRGKDHKPAGLGRHTGPILWTLHGWTAIFFVGAAYAKLTQPLDILTLLMAWPAATHLEVVRLVGWIELTLATAQFSFLLFNGRLVRAVALTAASILTANATVMTVFYIVRLDPGLAFTNIVLVFLGVAILLGHRTAIRR